MDRGNCNMCGEFDHLEHHNLYVTGSEGIWLCKKCEILICEFIRIKQIKKIKSKLTGIKNARKLRTAKEES